MIIHTPCLPFLHNLTHTTLLRRFDSPQGWSVPLLRHLFHATGCSFITRCMFRKMFLFSMFVHTSRHLPNEWRSHLVRQHSGDGLHGRSIPCQVCP